MSNKENHLYNQLEMKILFIVIGLVIAFSIYKSITMKPVFDENQPVIETQMEDGLGKPE